MLVTSGFWGTCDNNTKVKTIMRKLYHNFSRDFWHNRQKVWVEVISLLFDFDKTVKIVL